MILQNYGSSRKRQRLEDIITEYGYDADNVPKPTFWDMLKIMPNIANGVKNNIEWIDKTGKKSMTM